MDNTLITITRNHLIPDNKANYKQRAIEDARDFLVEIRRRMKTAGDKDLSGLVAAWDRIQDRLRIIAGDPLPQGRGNKSNLIQYRSCEPKVIEVPRSPDPGPEPEPAPPLPDEFGS